MDLAEAARQELQAAEAKHRAHAALVESRFLEREERLVASHKQTLQSRLDAAAESHAVAVSALEERLRLEAAQAEEAHKRSLREREEQLEEQAAALRKLSEQKAALMAEAEAERTRLAVAQATLVRTEQGEYSKRLLELQSRHAEAVAKLSRTAEAEQKEALGEKI